KPTLSDPEHPNADTFVAVLGGQPMQFVLTSVRAPEPIAWVAFGFAMNAAEARSLGNLVDLEGQFDIPAARTVRTHTPPVLITQGGSEQFLSLRTPLATRLGAVDLELRRPMQQVMAWYFKIRNVLLTIAALALACAIALALRVGRSAARPVEILA